MFPADLAHLRTPSAPSLSPDGRRVVVAVTRIDLDDNAYRSDLWLTPTDGSAAPRRFTSGKRDLRPRFSPDGRWIAFLRADDDDKPQLHVMPADGGEPRRVCEHPLGAQAFAWSPDSTRLAYVARLPEPGRYGTDKDVPPEKEPPRRITTFQYRLDDLGFTADRRPQVFVVDALTEGAEPLQLTRGDFDHGDPAWSPDGRTVAFVSARHETRDEDAVSDVFVAPADGGDARRVTATDLAVSRPAFSPDGATIWFCAVPSDLAGRTTGLWSVPADGSAAPRRLTDPERFDHEPAFGGGVLPLLVDERAVTTVSMDRGATPLLRFPVDGGQPQRLLDGRRQVQDYDVSANGVVAAVVSDPTSAGEVVVLEPEGSGEPHDGPAGRRSGPVPATGAEEPQGGGPEGRLQERTVTDFGTLLARSASLRPMTELEATAPDGAKVHGWVLKPTGTGPFPVVLMVHGGPFAQYGWTLFDEAQVYAGAGYAVVMGNPRGSSGYGESHGRAIVGDFGNLDAKDVLALLDAALADPDLDDDRVGVMGGSYGGFMTTWLVGHSDRFRAAISERACNAFDSFEGSSDIGWLFVSQYNGTDPERVLAQSPLTHVDRIHTPMLLVHSEHDWRCPVEQAQRLFVALKQRKVEVELLLFPGEGHELSRSGLPSHRVARFEAILGWWERHLKPSS
ncbi:MAG TPA: S9 family peptidase [Actinomycetes bacterium]|nr:S9 family peptidase [Actinomycetes bacterium]